MGMVTILKNFGLLVYRWVFFPMKKSFYQRCFMTLVHSMQFFSKRIRVKYNNSSCNGWVPVVVEFFTRIAYAMNQCRGPLEARTHSGLRKFDLVRFVREKVIFPIDAVYSKPLGRRYWNEQENDRIISITSENESFFRRGNSL